MSHNIFMIISVSLIVLSIAGQVAIGCVIQNMINETDNMTTTDNKLLRQCKLKFMNCYRMNGGVNNVQIFAEKFINRLKMGKISLVAVQHLTGQLILLSVFIAGIGIYLGITHNRTVLELLPYYIVSFLGLYLYFSVSSAMDIPGKKKILKTNLVDYFENHMISHLGKVPESLRELEEKEMQMQDMDGMGSPGNEKSEAFEDAIEPEAKAYIRPTVSNRVNSGSRDSARNRARIAHDAERKNDSADSWQDVLRDNLSDDEIQALLSEFLA